MKVGRNDPCPCGSGRKYKQCHMLQEQQAAQIENIGAMKQELNQHYSAGRVQKAQELALRIVQIDPRCERALHILGFYAMQAGQCAVAADWFTKAIAANPSNFEHYNSLSTMLIRLDQLVLAMDYLKQGLAIAPSADAYNSLGAVLQGLNRHSDAVEHFRNAVGLNPTNATMWTNLGNALSATEIWDEAGVCFERALDLAPGKPEALLGLGNSYVSQGYTDQAITTFVRLLEISPDLGLAHNNLANLLQLKGLHSHASEHFKRAFELCTGALKIDIASSRLFNLAQQAGVDAAENFRAHLQFGEVLETDLRSEWPKHANEPNPERKIRVGFVSGDLRSHPVASFLEPLLVHFSQSAQLELYAYFNYQSEDLVSQRLKRKFFAWRSVLELKDEELVKKIQDDAIDILIDLSGHTGFTRLFAFARKPAPVQVSWIGYPGTTGLKAMDYYLTDSQFLPPGQFEDQFIEKIVRLPAEASFQSLCLPPEVSELPAIASGRFTFGSFNRGNKISRNVIALWAKLLRAVPNANMVLGAMDKDGENSQIEGWFAEEGVGKMRLTFFGGRPLPDYLTLHHEVDMCLDTFPYNGGTTTFYAAIMGVPTLTLAGQTPASRSGAGILGQLGLQAFVAHDHEEFVRKGVAWAGNLEDLAHIRKGLRERLEQSPLGQPAVVAAGVEQALRTMWRRWCAGLPPESFAVDEQSLPSR